VEGTFQNIRISTALDNKELTVGVFIDLSKAFDCGVPQGSILGPLLFLIYINDLHLISDEALFILYADDTNIFITDKDEHKLIDRMNSVLDRLDNWFKFNKLSLNVEK
jgi:hypothetical protein